MSTATVTRCKRKRLYKSYHKRPQARTAYPREGLATVKDAMEFLRVGRTTLYKLIDQDKIERVPDTGYFVRLTWRSLHVFAKTPGIDPTE